MKELISKVANDNQVANERVHSITVDDIEYNFTNTDMYYALTMEQDSDVHITDQEGRMLYNINDYMKLLNEFPITYQDVSNLISEASIIADKFKLNSKYYDKISELAYDLLIGEGYRNIAGTEPWDKNRKFQTDNRISNFKSTDEECYDGKHAILLKEYNDLYNEMERYRNTTPAVLLSSKHFLTLWQENSNTTYKMKELSSESLKVDLRNNEVFFFGSVCAADGTHPTNADINLMFSNLSSYSGNEVTLLHAGSEGLEHYYDKVDPSGTVKFDIKSLSPIVLALGHVESSDVEAGEQNVPIVYTALIIASMTAAIFCIVKNAEDVCIIKNYIDNN